MACGSGPAAPADPDVPSILPVVMVFESTRWLVAPGWANDDAHCRALFDDRGRATQGIDGL
jgi:hypothetical protein